MLIERECPFTSKVNTMDIPITEKDYNDLVKRPFPWKWSYPNELIQDRLYYLNADQREFIMTGITPEEWDATFPEEDES